MLDSSMIFKVYAGTIFCGILRVTQARHEHLFITASGEKSGNYTFGSIDLKVAGYKKLRLKRVAC